MQKIDAQLTLAPTKLDGQDAAITVNVYEKLPTEAEIQLWLMLYLAELLEIDVDEVEVRTSFNCYGLDSAAAMVLSSDSKKWLGMILSQLLISLLGVSGREKALITSSIAP